VVNGSVRRDGRGALESIGRGWVEETRRREAELPLEGKETERRGWRGMINRAQVKIVRMCVAVAC
jgi:hypothetical protein